MRACISMLQWIFTAVPVGGGPAVTATSPSPDARFKGLRPDTQARFQLELAPCTHHCRRHCIEPPMPWQGWVRQTAPWAALARIQQPRLPHPRPWVSGLVACIHVGLSASHYFMQWQQLCILPGCMCCCSQAFLLHCNGSSSGLSKHRFSQIFFMCACPAHVCCAAGHPSLPPPTPLPRPPPVSCSTHPHQAALSPRTTSSSAPPPAMSAASPPPVQKSTVPSPGSLPAQFIASLL